MNQLRRRVLDLFGDDSGPAMRTSVVSFGYKHGVPLDADLVFDCRFLPNPHWVEALRPLSGLDEPVRDFVLGQEAARALPGPGGRPGGHCCCPPTSPRASPI